jgi:hypothetical protein
VAIAQPVLIIGTYDKDGKPNAKPRDATKVKYIK